MVEATIALHYVFDSPKDNQPVAIRFPNTDVISTGVKIVGLEKKYQDSMVIKR